LLERIATLQELETWYSLCDVMDRNEALDAWQEAEREAHQQKKR